MLPVLFAANTTTWTSFGIGVLSDAISCEVEENRNGAYELELQYPIDGMFYSEIALRTIILAKPNYTDTPQPFRVYAISKPINGIVTVSAQHISYDLSGYVDAPFTADGISNALTAMLSSANIYPTSCPFTFATDISSAQSMAPKYPASVRALMGGIEGSLIDIYGGEWHFNGLTCTLKAARGTNRGVEIRYGKNMTDLRQEENNAAVYTAVYPYYYNADNNDLVTLTEKVIAVTGTFDYSRVLPLDLTSEFGEKPSESQLRTRATSYITENNIGVPKVNLTISFANQDSIQDRVDLCDTVTVKFDALGVSASAKCIRTKWDVLKERYIEAELGSARNSLAATIAKTSEIEQEIKEHSAQFKTVASKIASVVTGNSGGYILLHDTNEDGMPDEILILDTSGIETATNVIRINNSGIAFSSTGYNGTYTTAWNINGQLSANFIASGSIATDQVTVLGDTQFKWDSDGISMIDPNDSNKIIRLGKYDGTNYGLGFSIDGGTNWIAGFGFQGLSVIGNANNSGYAEMTGSRFKIIASNGVSVTDIGEGPCHDENNTIVTGARHRIGSWYGNDGDGNVYTFEQAHGLYSFSGGIGNLPRGIQCVCMGYFNKSIGDKSICIGQSNKVKNKGIAIGKSCEVSGYTEVWYSSDDVNFENPHYKGDDGIAIGIECETTFGTGVAIGRETKIGCPKAVGIGSKNTIPLGCDRSVCIGNNNSFSSGAECFVIGYLNEALEYYTTLIGTKLKANQRGMIAFGRYNSPSSGDLLNIGNGTSDSNRSNALVLKSNGNMTIAGSLTQNSDGRQKDIIGIPPDLIKIRAVRFKWNDKKKNHDNFEHIGYIAQEVESLAPYLVHEDSSGHKTLDYIGLLCAKVEKLEQTVMQLMQRIIVLEGAANAT